MSVKIRFQTALATRLVLAKVGNPQRDEPLQTSKNAYQIQDKDQATLTGLFLKPFKNLLGHRFTHHASLDQHEMNNYSKAIFASNESLYEKSCEIAKRLYAKSNHPNIKSGDLCIAYVKDVEVNEQMVDAICILKAESVVPFLSISAKNGDLELSTEHGINPEKIDKGCLILNHHEFTGYYVLTFDRSGSDSRFWVKDFLGVQAVTDNAFLTNAYASMAVAFLEEEKKQQKRDEEEDAPPWDEAESAKEAIQFFEDRDSFDVKEFEEQVLKAPDLVSKFQEHRARVEEEQGQRFEDNFEISKKDVSKTKKRLAKVMKLDTGVEITVKPEVLTRNEESPLEYGFDEERGMKYIKVFFHKDLARN